MTAAIDALTAALAALDKEQEATQQALFVAMNERNGREAEHQARLHEIASERAQCQQLLTVFLGEA